MLTKLRFWLALAAAAALPLAFYMIERQKSSTPDNWREAAKRRSGEAAKSARDAFDTVSEATLTSAGTVADTAARVADTVREGIALAPSIVGLVQRNGDRDGAVQHGAEDWRKYPQSLGR